MAAGSWSTWTGWTGCSVTCDSGTRVRHRSCQNGTCHEGMANSEEACSLGPCSNYKKQIIDVDFKTLRKNYGKIAEKEGYRQQGGTWESWTAWTSCSVTCGSGTRMKHRACPQGSQCQGQSASQEDCRVGKCGKNF